MTANETTVAVENGQSARAAAPAFRAPADGAMQRGELGCGRGEAGVCWPGRELPVSCSGLGVRQAGSAHRGSSGEVRKNRFWGGFFCSLWTSLGLYSSGKRQVEISIKQV